MRKNYLTILIFILSLSANAQSPILNFDGIDDYVALGTEAADNARTIELWFNLTNNVDSSLQNEILLIGTEIPTPNVNEWHLSIAQSGTANPAGTLRFAYIENIGQVAQVYSDSNAWEANKWYHVAVVIDSVQGMLMFVDGVLQSHTLSSFNTHITSNGSNVELGRQIGFNRYLNGKVDDLRISSSAIYLTNFTPPCTDIPANSTTIGLWNFNDNSGLIASDSGPFGYDGQISGAAWDTANICKTTNMVALSERKPFKIYPTPSNGVVHFQTDLLNNNKLKLVIYDFQGRAIFNKQIISENFTIDLTYIDAGVYFIDAWDDSNNIRYSGKIIKR